MRRLTVSFLAGVAAISISGAALAQNRTAGEAGLTRDSVQQRAAQTFERMDLNRDGKIDAADRQARAKARFDRTDANSDGAIDFAEYTAKRERPESVAAERSAPRAEHMGHRGMRGGMGLRGPGREADGDGVITRAEFEAALLARFDIADADNDGTVTAAERKAQRDAMREQWRERRARRAS